MQLLSHKTWPATFESLYESMDFVVFRRCGGQARGRPWYFFVKQLIDEVNCRREKDRNRLTLVFCKDKKTISFLTPCR